RRPSSRSRPPGSTRTSTDRPTRAGVGFSGTRRRRVFVRQQVAGLTAECVADGIERGEPYRSHSSALEGEQVRGCDADGVGELLHGHLPLGEFDVQTDDDRHQTTPASSSAFAVAVARSWRITRTTSANATPPGMAAMSAYMTPAGVAPMRVRAPKAAAIKATNATADQPTALTCPRAGRRKILPFPTIVSSRQITTSTTSTQPTAPTAHATPSSRTGSSSGNT